MYVNQTADSKSSIQKMTRNYQSHLFVLAIALVILLILPFVNCTNDPMKKTFIKKSIERTTTLKSDVYDLFKQEKLNNDNEKDEMKQLIERFFKTYPNRRALSFHAMRGKRSIKTA